MLSGFLVQQDTKNWGNQKIWGWKLIKMLSNLTIRASSPVSNFPKFLESRFKSYNRESGFDSDKLAI